MNISKLCLVAFFAALLSSDAFAETKPPKAEKIEALAALKTLQDELYYEVFGADPVLDKAQSDFNNLVQSWRDSSFEIFQKKFADYGIPAEWVAGAKNWEDVQRNFQKSVLGPLPPGMTEGSRYGSPYLIAPLDFTRNKHHAWVIRRSAQAVEEQGFAWSDDLEEMARGVKQFKESEKEYLEILRIGTQQGEVIWQVLPEQWSNSDCGCLGITAEPPFPVAPDLEPGAPPECAKDATPACLEAWRAASRQYLRMLHELSKTLDRLLRLEYKKFFYPIGENMKGQLPGRKEGDKP